MAPNLSTARHEAAHHILARMFGCRDIKSEVVGIKGLCTFTPPDDIDPQALRVIGLAGFAADHLFKGSVDPVAFAEAANEPRGLSDADRALTGAVDVELAVETLQLVAAHAPQIKYLAFDLVQQSHDRQRSVVRLNDTPHLDQWRDGQRPQPVVQQAPQAPPQRRSVVYL